MELTTADSGAGTLYLRLWWAGMLGGFARANASQTA
jgi:hypothetical protein